ncbi:MAG: hypothetical protein HYX32_02925 [Actinobacteria bacterium]|nr:hypothetical protein [Actinomycetota bacterium]
MQPTDTQVQRSLAALRDDEAPHDRFDLHEADQELTTEQLPSGLVEQLERTPAVRPERLAEARLRLATGEVPTADDLASRMVGRLVCDRLR